MKKNIFQMVETKSFHRRKTARKLVSGFTLTELLISIAIIGLLVAIAIVSYDQAKEQAVDARILTEMNNLLSESRIHFTQYGRYDNPNGGVCSFRLYESVKGLGGESKCNQSPDDWAVSVQLVFESEDHLCVDSREVVRRISKPLEDDETQCPGS